MINNEFLIKNMLKICTKYYFIVGTGKHTSHHPQLTGGEVGGGTIIFFLKIIFFVTNIHGHITSIVSRNNVPVKGLISND